MDYCFLTEEVEHAEGQHGESEQSKASESLAILVMQESMCRSVWAYAVESKGAKEEWLVEQILEDGEWAILEWKDPLGLRGCGFFQVIEGKIKLQRGYWDKLSFLRQHNLPIPPMSET